MAHLSSMNNTTTIVGSTNHSSYLFMDYCGFNIRKGSISIAYWILF